jgi:hypothetical protein
MTPRQRTCGRCGSPAPWGFWQPGSLRDWSALETRLPIFACDEHRDAAQQRWREIVSPKPASVSGTSPPIGAGKLPRPSDNVPGPGPLFGGAE